MKQNDHGFSQDTLVFVTHAQLSSLMPSTSGNILLVFPSIVSMGSATPYILTGVFILLLMLVIAALSVTIQYKWNCADCECAACDSCCEKCDEKTCPECEKLPDPGTYTKTENKDSSGNDIGKLKNVEVDVLKKSCDLLDNCVGFNSSGWLKNKLVPFTDASDLDFYKKDAPAPV